MIYLKVNLSVYFFIIFFSAMMITFSFADPRKSVSGLYCGTNRLSTTDIIPTFVSEMEAIANQIEANRFATFHISNSSISLYTLAQCHHDLSSTDCLLCYATARVKLPNCLPNDGGRIYLDGCFLRYDNYSFYGDSVLPKFSTVNCSDQNVSIGSGEIGMQQEFMNSVGFAVGNVSEIAVRDGGFGVFQVGGVYALAQCWQSVSTDGCRECLANASMAAKGCGLKKEGRGMNAGCYLRYSTEKFYSDGDSKRKGKFSMGIIITIAFIALAILVLSLFAAWTVYIKRRKENKDIVKFTTSLTRAGLNYNYETLEKATYYFSPARKLGQGGAGTVYIGTLPSGENVAVKRLTFHTKQWVDEFFNEVNLISKIQHKNLVKLLGCSMEGPESLLVYEYVPNKSLDYFLFVKNKPPLLNWKQRFNIITGTAEGLAYLHGGAHVRIIHRDIKSSNILLDNDLNAKIADFGLVRCFGTDVTHISTGVAGTLGYMAPEYLVRGQLTEKADVYSFGILALEIVCGRKNSTFIDNSSSLLQVVWRLYKSNRLSEAVDPNLDNNFPKDEASNVLQIGLLCAQSMVALRPSMEEVIMMLTSEDYPIPSPSQPPFSNARLLDPAATSSWSYSTNSSTSNVPTKFESSYTSSETTDMIGLERPPRS